MSTSSGTPATETAGHDPNAVPGSSSRRFFMLRPRQDSEQAHQDPYITSSGFRPCFIGRYIRRFCKTLDNPGRNHGTWPTTLNSRPRFCQWGREYWPDLLLLAVLGLASLFIFLFAPPALAQHRRFPLYNPDGSVVNQSIAYPLTENIIPIWLSALLSIVVPVIVYLLMFLRVKSFWDLNNAILGTIYALVAAELFQQILKKLVGGFRPHFLARCKPKLPTSDLLNGHAGLVKWFTADEICTGPANGPNGYFEALESFPSGHTTAAFATAVFLTLYLNAKLKIFANYQPQFWKLVLVMCPLLGAILIGGTLTIDGFHQPTDVIAGAIIGTSFGLAGYRMMYAAIWDFRFNHIPLSKRHAFLYHAGDGKYASFYDAVATRKAAWGTQGMYCLSGAPNDVWQYQGGGKATQLDGHASSDDQEKRTSLDSGMVRRKPAPQSLFRYQGLLPDVELGVDVRKSLESSGDAVYAGSAL